MSIVYDSSNNNKRYREIPEIKENNCNGCAFYIKATYFFTNCIIERKFAKDSEKEIPCAIKNIIYKEIHIHKIFKQL